MMELIGYYELDPNRVIDLILDCLELSVDESYGSKSSSPDADTATSVSADNYIKLLQTFNLKNLVHLIGFKVS